CARWYYGSSSYW
nr:immunoglobulin heavy chain junction region [Mus musculus]MBK4196660.1 immunoglobulin heavy chain junction region [Mus musculus]MBK4196661.1 immunoglobulin heavy chain junction region [Mus musculus]